MCRMGNAIHEAYQDQLVSNDKKNLFKHKPFWKSLGIY